MSVCALRRCTLAVVEGPLKKRSRAVAAGPPGTEIRQWMEIGSTKQALCGSLTTEVLP